MAIISVSITESEEQVVAGIPRFISLAASVPCTIFFTLDGTDPDLFSNIYISPIYFPTNNQSVTVKILATNGVISSPIIVETYKTNIINNTRLPHAPTDAQASANKYNLYPFGSNSFENGTYLNPADAGVTVNNPALPEIGNAFDADGNPTAFSNEDYTIENYSIIYNSINSKGESGPGIGNLPGKVEVERVPAAPEESNQNSFLFNPKASVIFQDASKEDLSNPPIINSQFFSLEDPSKVSDGNNYYSCGLDSASAPTGTFVRAHYNPRDNTITHYYYDSRANRWIISKAPYVPNGTFDGNLADIKFGRSRHVYEWLPFGRRYLF